MDTNEIMTEVVETPEEIATESSGTGIVIAAKIVLAGMVGLIAYKYVVEPIMAKIKAKKERKTETDESAQETPEDESGEKSDETE
jgi:flagellar biosynthesis/type III secretory pathway M-ring protein FliF/YscJ